MPARKRQNALQRCRKFWQSIPKDQLYDVWAIMSALRGPDESALHNKLKSTGPVRFEVMTPAIANACGLSIGTTGVTVETLTYVRKEHWFSSVAGSHFTEHTYRAHLTIYELKRELKEDVGDSITTDASSPSQK